MKNKIVNDIHLDFDRESRIGFKEVVYAEGKSVETLINIITQFKEKNSNVLLTCLSKYKYTELKKSYKLSFYDENSGIGVYGEFPETNEEPVVGILSAGSSDSFVVDEAYYTLRYMGISALRLQDIGVAGIKRFINKLDYIRKFKVIIVIAGFEGALASVAGGVLSQPVIAVPTSVGYGVAKNGETALNAMLASCANGISVVNIDNGYGAAMAAKRIIQTFYNNK